MLNSRKKQLREQEMLMLSSNVQIGKASCSVLNLDTVLSDTGPGLPDVSKPHGCLMHICDVEIYWLEIR